MTENDSTILVATGSASVTESVQRLAAAAHLGVAFVPDAETLRRRWHEPRLVLVDADVAAGLGPAPSRRPGVLLAATTENAAVLRSALDLGAERVVVLPDDESWLVEQMVASAEAGSDGVLLAVTSACGGAGATTLGAAAAARAARAGLSVTVVDAAARGGVLEHLLGLASCDGLRWDDLAHTSGRLPGTTLAEALPQRGGLSLLAGASPGLGSGSGSGLRPGVGPGSSPGARPGSGAGFSSGTGSGLASGSGSGSGSGAGHDDPGPSAAVVSSVCAALGRTRDLVVLDVPSAALQECRPCLAAADVVGLVTTGDTRGVVAADAAVARLADDGARLQLVVRSVRGVALDPHDMAARLGVPLLAAVRDDRRVRVDADRGEVVARRCLRAATTRLLHAAHDARAQP